MEIRPVSTAVGAEVLGVDLRYNLEDSEFSGIQKAFSEYGVLFDKATSIQIKNNTFEDNGRYGNKHVAMALDPGIGQVEDIKNNTNRNGLKMSGNKYLGKTE